MKVLFLYLKGFSFTGGIEKFNRSFLKAIHELSVDGIMDAEAVSSHDPRTDEKYFPRMRFTGFGGNKPLFVIYMLFKALRYDSIIVGHINLAVVALLMKKVNPSLKLILIAHGIEIWERQKGMKARLVQLADRILSVSEYTKSRILQSHPDVDPDKIRIFPNTLDPYFEPPRQFSKPDYLLNRYNLPPQSIILLTVTRLSSTEKYKGYDNVILSMRALSEKLPNVKYLLCGRADESERRRIEDLIQAEAVEDKVKLIGYVADDELTDHYKLADVFVMQSKKEGFGIVFIEALACGRKVIAGSKDGSSEALLNGELGKLIDPDCKEELQTAIVEYMRNNHYEPHHLQKKVIDAFGFARYKKRLGDFLRDLAQSSSVQ